MKQCFTCREKKPVNEYDKASRNKDGICANCKTCQKAYTKQTIQKKVEFVTSYKLENGCAICGYDKCSESLHFDHLPGHDKYKNVGWLAQNGYGWKTIIKEIEKCQVLCANCHGELTQQRRKEENNGR